MSQGTRSEVGEALEGRPPAPPAQGTARAPAWSEGLAQAFEAHRAFLWGLLYRLTGTVGDADDLLQETFLRLMTSPPARPDLPLRPWLTRVAANLGRDLLRRRRRARQNCYWLPSPWEVSEPILLATLPTSRAPSSDHRYELMESVSMAFLEALEALTPQQRAVLLLRDVCELSVEEVAEALSLSETNIKVTHHRARKAMHLYHTQAHTRAGVAGATDAGGSSRHERNLLALQQFLYRMAAGDVAGMAALLAADARAVTDGGGEFFAARVPVFGAEKVAKFFAALGKMRPLGGRGDLRWLNGQPAYLHRSDVAPPRYAQHSVLTVEVNEQGLITVVRSFLATRKLVGIRFDNLSIQIPNRASGEGLGDTTGEGLGGTPSVGEASAASHVGE